MLKQTFAVLLAIIFLVAAQGGSGPGIQRPVSEFCLTVVFVDVVYDPVLDRTTFHYRVTVPFPANCPASALNTKDLSHWVLQICPALVPFIVSTNPPVEDIGPDPSVPVPFFGIKWGSQAAGTVVDYYVTFQGDLAAGDSQYLIKNQDFGIGPIVGPQCGTLNIFKYNDLNANGQQDAGEPGLSGWEFQITGPQSSTVTTGSTPILGNAQISNLPSGTYTITETLKSTWVNTDPGTTPIQKTINYVAGSSPTVRFGNTCAVSITFRVCGIPTYFGNNANIFLTYSVVSGTTQNPPSPVQMTYDALTQCASVTVNNQFNLNTVINWGISSPGLGSVVLVQNQAFTECQQTVTATLTLATVTSQKLKDNVPIGVTGANDIGVSGFVFTLTRLNPSISLGSVMSGANGVINIGPLAPGIYSLQETVPAGWQITSPNPQVFIVNLGDTSVTVPPFRDTPLTNVKVTVSPQTSYTFGTITCTTADGQTYSGAINTLTLTNLRLDASPIDCSITLSDP